MGWNIERREARYRGENDIIFVAYDSNYHPQADYFYFEDAKHGVKLVCAKDHEGKKTSVDAAEKLIRWSSNCTKVFDGDGDILVELKVNSGDKE